MILCAYCEGRIFDDDRACGTCGATKIIAAIPKSDRPKTLASFADVFNSTGPAILTARADEIRAMRRAASDRWLGPNE